MYEQQLDRVKRFLDRIRKPIFDQVEYEDMLWAFFQNCWHLHDWILNDDAAPKMLKDGISKDARTIHSLQLCADLANRSKHLTLDPRHPTGWRDGQVRNDATVLIGESMSNGSTTTVKKEFRYFVTESDGTEHPVLDLAAQAVTEWEALIAKYR